jgi:hypothetical protein
MNKDQTAGSEVNVTLTFARIQGDDDTTGLSTAERRLLRSLEPHVFALLGEQPEARAVLLAQPMEILQGLIKHTDDPEGLRALLARLDRQRAGALRTPAVVPGVRVRSAQIKIKK